MMLPFIVPTDRNLRVSARVSIPEIPESLCALKIHPRSFVDANLKQPAHAL